MNLLKGTGLNQIRGIVFDLDGTLVSSTLDFNQIRLDLDCPPGEDVLSFVEALSPQERAKAEAIIHQHEVDDAEQSEWLPGAKAFVDQCLELGVPLAILTRNSEFASKKKISKNNIPISLLFTRENSLPKPDPSALNEIAKLFSLPNHSIMMVGDYKYDLEAGRNAKMSTCLVNCEGEPDYLHLADHRYSSFIHLHEAFFNER
jgi:HAD superfamily hydrolase (TIGR01509 family)